MAYEEKQLPHRLALEERNNLTVSGVEDVESFDENAVVIQTFQGLLVVRGEGLH
ncbi:MAG: YabP/YqfC family sporulation protein, partial [Oscillospiraceae bacterium]|nr:YabP/YqfC family sporulation protein [Oscillospiraceae bacterium]